MKSTVPIFSMWVLHKKSGVSTHRGSVSINSGHSDTVGSLELWWELKLGTGEMRWRRGIGWRGETGWRFIWSVFFICFFVVVANCVYSPPSPTSPWPPPPAPLHVRPIPNRFVFQFSAVQAMFMFSPVSPVSSPRLERGGIGVTLLEF